MSFCPGRIRVGSEPAEWKLMSSDVHIATITAKGAGEGWGGGAREGRREIILAFSLPLSEPSLVWCLHAASVVSDGKSLAFFFFFFFLRIQSEDESEWTTGFQET